MVDILNPQVTINAPLIDQNFSLTQEITLDVTAIDDIGIDSVVAEFFLPNNSSQNISLTPSSNNTYLANISLPNLTGTYNITIIANDTSGNVNNTQTTHFNAIDITAPTITLISPQNLEEFNFSENVLIDVNVSDNIAVDSVFAIINSSVGNVTILPLSFVNLTQYSGNFTLPQNFVGIYDIEIQANDTSNNTNSITFQIEALDNIAPQVVDTSGLNGTSIEYGSTITINSTITDSIGVDFAFARITLPNSTNQTITLTNDSNSNIFISNFTLPNVLGTFTITLIANDTSNNINDSESFSFTTIDTTLPIIDILSPPINATFNTSDTFTIQVNFTDDIGTDSLNGEVHLPNGTIESLNLSTLGSIFSTQYTIENITGEFSIQFVGNDTTGNTNSQNITFEVVDTQDPIIHSITPNNGTTLRIFNTLIFEVNTSDNVEIDSVIAEIRLPNNTSQNISLVDLGNTIFNTTFVLPNVTGQYNVTFIVNDSSRNTINETVFFDVVRPEIINSSINRVAIENGSTVSYFVDAKNFSSVFALTTLPNGSVNNLTLNNGLDTLFTNTSEVGNYSIQIIAQDVDGNRDSEFHSFQTFTVVPLNFTIDIVNSTDNNSVLNIIFDDTIIESQNGSLENITGEIINTTVDVQVITYNESLQILFEDVNMSSNFNGTLQLDLTFNDSTFDILFGIKNTFNFTNATVTFNYEGINFTNESNLNIFKCDDYNFTSRVCNSAFVNLTPNATHNELTNTFTLVVNSFSGFGIREIEPSSGSSSSGSSSSGSSSGGSEGGGGSSSKSNGNSLADNIPQLQTNSDLNNRCTTNWICTDWEATCPADGIQKRTCINRGTCSGDQGKPSETRTCSTFTTSAQTPLFVTQTQHSIDDENEQLVVQMNLSSIPISEGESVLIVHQFSNGEEIIQEFSFEELNLSNLNTQFLDTSTLDIGNYTLVSQLIVDDTRYLNTVDFEISEKATLSAGLFGGLNNVLVGIIAIAVMITLLALITTTLFYFELV